VCSEGGWRGSFGSSSGMEDMLQHVQADHHRKVLIPSSIARRNAVADSIVIWVRLFRDTPESVVR